MTVSPIEVSAMIGYLSSYVPIAKGWLDPKTAVLTPPGILAAIVIMLVFVAIDFPEHPGAREHEQRGDLVEDRRAGLRDPRVRALQLQLKHRWEGYYVVLQAKAEPAAMDELHRVLSLADEVLRHKVLRIPEQRLREPADRRAGVSDA